MTHFPVLRTRRLDVTLRELSIKEGVALAHINPLTYEAATTAMLGMIVAEARGEHADPRLWTVQERALVVAQYLGVILDEANFEVGDGRYLDYLDHGADYPGELSAELQACDDVWRVRHVLGVEAELLESVSTCARDWVIGDMALRLVRDKDGPRPDAVNEAGKFAEWLRERMDTLEAFPGSTFSELYLAYAQGVRELHHFFTIGCDKHGFTVWPQTEAGAGETPLAPARFPVSSCLPELAFALCD